MDLKPVSHTKHSKFKPHPYLYEKYRSQIPKNLKKTDKATPSPYQMMLEEMKQIESDVQEGPSRRRIEQFEDSLEFKGGSVDVEALRSSDLRESYHAYEENIERIMQQTGSTIFDPNQVRHHIDATKPAVGETLGASRFALKASLIQTQKVSPFQNQAKVPR